MPDFLALLRYEGNVPAGPGVRQHPDDAPGVGRAVPRRGPADEPTEEGEADAGASPEPDPTRTAAPV